MAPEIALALIAYFLTRYASTKGKETEYATNFVIMLLEY
jgi:hypothetical protein